MTQNRRVVVIGVTAAVVAGLAGRVAAQPLDRTLADYCVFAQRSLAGKNLHVDSACNVGVNCAQPSANSPCGVATFEDAMFADGSQLASDKVGFNRAFAVVAQLFTNKPFNTANVTLLHPPSHTFTTPIIAGTCDGSCNSSPSAIEQFCNFPKPFPDCDPGKPVIAQPGLDCSSFDSNPGNGVCDLAPGTYGDISVQNLAHLNFTNGAYNICSLTVGKNATIQGSSTVLNIADDGFLRVNNASKFGDQNCGEFKVRIEAKGSVSLGRNVVFAAQVCGPQSEMSLGHGNVLLGQFIGLDIDFNRDNSLKACCDCSCAP